MQRTHRIRHRVIWLILAPLLVLLLAVAFFTRPQWPVMEALPVTSETPAAN